MSNVETNRAIVDRIFTEVLNGGDFTVSDALVADDALFYTHARPAPFVGPAGFREYIGGVRAGIPDTRVVVHETVAEGDTVIAHWTLHGTHTGTLLGLPPTGSTVALEALELVHLRDGKLTEIRLSMDGMSIMRQLGVIPAGEGVPKPMVWMIKAKTAYKRLRRR
jgi:steroid delta-isomerase-like uncharacterized protein